MLEKAFISMLMIAPAALVSGAEPAEATVEEQVTVLRRLPAMPLQDAVKTILNLKEPAGVSPDYQQMLHTLRNVAWLIRYDQEKNAAEKAKILKQSMKDNPGAYLLMLMINPELQKHRDKLLKAMVEVTPEQLRRDAQLLSVRCGVMVTSAGPSLSPAKRRDIVLRELSGYPMASVAQSILAVHYLYPEYQMVDLKAAHECILRGAQARLGDTQLTHANEGSVPGSLLLSLAYAAAQEEGVDTVPLQFGALSLAVHLDGSDVWARYRMGRLWLDHAENPALSPYLPQQQACRQFEAAAREGHTPSLHELGLLAGQLSLVEMAEERGYDSSVDYSHVSPGSVARYNMSIGTKAFMPDATERAFAKAALVTLVSLFRQWEDVKSTTTAENASMVQQFSQMVQMMIASATDGPDELEATDAELLAHEKEYFRASQELMKDDPYMLYLLYLHGVGPTGVGRDPEMAEKYLQQAAHEQEHPKAIEELRKRESPASVAFVESLLESAENESDSLTALFMKMAEDALGNILTLDDALHAWAAAHPEQQKLAEALRLHYLLYVHNASWRTSPENNAITLEVRKRLRLIIQEIPSEVMDADRKQYVLKTFDVQDAMEARNLRRWKAAHRQ